MTRNKLLSHDIINIIGGVSDEKAIFDICG